MAEILGGFDANSVEPAQAFECLPAGQYDVAITDAGTYITSSDKFLALKLQFAVMNGQFQNRKLYLNCLCIKRNPAFSGAWDQKADETVRIGAGKFSALCRAVNVLTPKDTNEFLGKPLRVSIRVKSDDNGNKQNEVTGFMPRSAMPVAGTPVSPVMQQPAMAGSSNGSPF